MHLLQKRLMSLMVRGYKRMENLGTSIFAAAIVILVLLLIMGIVLSIVNLKKTKAQKQFFADLHSNLTSGQRIMFAGGLYGTVTKVGTDVVEVKVKDGTTLDVSRYAIQEIVSHR